MIASPLLAAYRLMSAGMGVAGPLYLYWRGILGHDDFLRRHERLGRPSLGRPAGRLALLRLANSAEAIALAPLAERLGQLRFGVLVSIRNLQSGLVRARHFPPALHQLSPLDTPQSVSRFLDHWRPDIAMLCGAELAANFVMGTKDRRIPLFLFNARMPARRFLLLRRFPALAASLLGQIDLCLAQTDADAGRFRALGSRFVRVTGSLKYDAAPLPADQFALARLAARIGTRPAWVADGIARDESEIVIAVHCQVARHFPDVATIIIPHDPDDSSAIARGAAKKGLSAGLRGADRETMPFPQIYIVHPAEEAGLFYRAAGVVFAGKSLSRGGGKNPAQAAQLGCAVLHGPEIEEFEDFYAALDDAGGGTLVLDADSLAKELALLFFDKAELRAMARAARETAETFGGAAARIIEAIAPYVAQTIVTPRGFGG